MAKRSKDNLRIKRKYLLWRKDAQGISEASLDKSAAAITLYDDWLGGKNFQAFHAERARSFKRHLAGLRNERTGAPLSAATTNGTLRELKAFFYWMADQPGYKSKISRSDAGYLTPDRKSETARRGTLWKPHPSPAQARHVIETMPSGTVIERRNRALLAFLFLTGSREGAAISLDAIAAATEAPPAMCAASVLAAAALAVQGLADVQTLGGARPASVFLLTVAESGERKSSADRLAMQGVRAFEASLRPEYDDDLETYNRERAIWEKRRAAILRNADDNPAATRADLTELGTEPHPPLRPSIVTGAATVEGIVKHLPDLRASLGIMTDEGGLMLGGHSMKAENRLNTLATFTSMWDASPLDRWRAGDGIATYSGRRFSCHIMLQPSAAEAFLSDPLANGQGLLARFLTCKPASHIGQRLRIAEDATATAEIERFAAMIENIMRRPMALADGCRNELSLPVLTLAPDARAVLTDFAREVEKAQAPGGGFEDCRAFASKTAEHAARLAAVMALIADPNASHVSAETVADGATLATFYANEACRIHAAAIVPTHVADAERLRRWLIGSWPEEYITAAIAAQRGPFKVTDRNRKAMQTLAGHGWLIESTGAAVDGKARREAWKVVRA